MFKKQILQMHQQVRGEESTKLIEQREISDYAEMRVWINSVYDNYPLPKNTVWLMVQSDSPLFQGRKEQ